MTMDLRFLGKVLQGALIGLGAVLPGISGGVFKCSVRSLSTDHGAAVGSGT